MFRQQQLFFRQKDKGHKNYQQENRNQPGAETAQNPAMASMLDKELLDKTLNHLLLNQTLANEKQAEKAVIEKANAAEMSKIQLYKEDKKP